MKRFFILSTTLTFLAAGALLAQNPNPNDQPAEPDGQPDGQYEQGRAVARISVLNGDVSVRRGDSNEVVAAALNAPLLANDSLLTSSSGRAEVQLDYGKILRIGPNSEVHFAGLDVKSFQIQIAAGTVTFRVLRPSDSQAELDTPSVAVRPLREGVYRISVREDGTAEITVRAGAAEIASPKGTEQLGPGRTMYARGSADDPEFQVSGAIGLDSWDRWNEDRDRYLERSRSYEHVSRDISGAEDLDQYGQWVDDPSYGQVWAPTVASGWAPYHDGRWVWEDWYGWTWVSYDPWGWAPYHYGRWFYGGRGWCWYPGSIYARHFWAPAYVGFFGFGGRFGGGFGFGGLGWVPLAPFEGFHPWWGRGFYGGFRGGAFANRTTIINNTNITNVYRNARINGAVTGVNAGDFGRHTGQFQTLNHAQIQQTGLVRGVVPVAPNRTSLQLSDRNVQGNFSRNSAQNFASRNPATRVDRVPFDQQQRGMQQLSRGNFNAGAGNSNTGTTGGANGGWQRAGASPAGTDRGNFTPNNNARTGNPSGQPGVGQTNHDWGRFGQPIHGTGGVTPQSQAPAGGSNRSSNNPGWQRFDNSRPPNSGGSNGSPAPRNFTDSRGYSGGGGGSQPVRISPPIVQQRTPSYEAPRNYSPSPSYQAPRNYSPSPSYQAPRNYSPSPSYQAPRNNGGGGGGGRSAPSGGGSRGSNSGGGHSSGGGGSRGGGSHR